ncbi:uncharacterized protein LOC134958390 isoform X2 [Pseudophryne corroboree]|uniref:uncharacterized protein LOC134958390 isoform X2 n=1 Tax=Pseudophryne corroboree TaxID=495146 RepID=UPI003081FF90
MLYNNSNIRGGKSARGTASMGNLWLPIVLLLGLKIDAGHSLRFHRRRSSRYRDYLELDFTDYSDRELDVVVPLPTHNKVTDTPIIVETKPDIRGLWASEIKAIEKHSAAAYNVASGGKTSQSSTKNRAASHYATDGQLSSQCTLTEEEYEPRWTLDLRTNHSIFSVAITNRRECCSYNLSGAEIHIGNNADWRHNPSCGTVPQMGVGETRAFSCYGMPGQLLTIAIPGRNASLSLCQVQVFGVPEVASEHRPWNTSHQLQNSHTGAPNMAQQGIASESSNYEPSNYAAKNASDGSLGNHMFKCSHTNNDLEPWWTLDLRSVMRIFSIAVTNRGDCCGERLNGAEIRVGNSKETLKNNPRCAVISRIDDGKTLSVSCHGMEGQYVSVIIPGRKEYLTLCEVQVFALPSDKPDAGIGTSIHPLGTEEYKDTQITEPEKTQKTLNAVAVPKITQLKASQSSTYGQGFARNAIDGSLAHQDPPSPCAVTDEQYQPWWTAELKSTYKIHSVALTNRGDCCPSDLDGAEIRVGHNASDWEHYAICGTVSSIGLGETFSFKCNWMEGKFITIVIPDRNVSLTVCEVQVFGERAETPSGSARWNGSAQFQKQNHGVPNVAPRGLTAQSSYYDKSKSAKLAADGKIFANYWSGSCTHTLNDLGPWWRVDLVSRMRVSSVAITNRGDCCGFRLNEAEIRIGNSEEQGSTYNPRCAKIISIGNGQTVSFDCDGMEGRFVSITIPGRKEWLSLCEVQVFAESTGEVKKEMYHNVALNGIATQSSTFSSSGNAENSNDGSLANNHIMSQCSITQRDASPWWKVDLQSTYKVFSVVITNRVLECCQDRIVGAEIRIGSSPVNGGTLNPRCGVISSMKSGESLFFSCNGMVGQYVTVTIPGREEHLIICEVQVFGVPETFSGPIMDGDRHILKTPHGAANVALQGSSSQSSLYNFFGEPRNAIDGSLASNYSQIQCSQTAQEMGPWWTVDLKGVFIVFSVAITNRQDCCWERINNAEIRIGNSQEWRNNQRCAVIYSLGPGETGLFSCNGMEGKYVTVIIPDRQEKLSLCEVQVFGIPSYLSEKPKGVIQGEGACFWVI